MAVILTPLFCKKKLNGIKYVSFCLILSILMIVFYLSFDLIYYKNHYEKQGLLKFEYFKPLNTN